MGARDDNSGREPIAAAMRSKLLETPVGPGLHVVSTPIGNLADISLRALATLGAADLILCEDTRVTAKLKSAFSIGAPLSAYHDHNAAKVLPGIIKTLEEGKIVALVSDAGTPTISDPGYRLINAAREADISVTAVPGASAVLTALAASGLPTDRFFFAGFPPQKEAARRKALSSLAEIPATLVFYESPNRLAASLAAMAEILGPRRAVIARELTKRHEEIRRGDLAALAAETAEAPPPKGEIVILTGPPEAPDAPGPAETDALLRAALETRTVRDAAAEIAAQTGLKRRDLYNRALALKDGDGGNG